MKDFLYGLNISALIIDIFLIFIIIYNVIKSARQGFISSLVSLILLVISCVLVWPLGKLTSKYIYNIYLKEMMSKLIYNKLINHGVSNIEGLKNLLNFKIPGIETSLLQNFQNINSNSSLNVISDMICDNIIYPVFNILTCVLVLIVVFFIFSLLIKLLRKIFRCFSYIPILGKLNIFLGAIFGFCKSMVIIVFIALIIDSLIIVSGNDWEFLNSQVKNDTYILKKCDEFIKIDNISHMLDEIKGLGVK